MKGTKFIIFVLLGIYLTSLLSGCATIMHGTRQSVGIASNPSNANVWVNRVHVGATPVIVELKRNSNHIVTLELEGYLPYEATFTKQVSGWVFGNLVFGGVIGLAVDAISGGLYKLTPEQVQAELRSQSFCGKMNQDSYIVITLTPNPAWEKIGNMVSVNP